MSRSDSFEPKLLGFLCNWCSYAGADLAGVSRFQYPTNLRVIRVMCSGRVDPTLVLEAFIRGIDGVMVLGCHPGDCHYLTGNYYEERRIRTLQKFLELLGVKGERLFLD
ncbi:MAG: hydrogenase iron-sulfur subunit, partial [Planctomycetota bacterium]